MNAQPFIHMKPGEGWQLIDCAELKQYQDLFYFLVVRDVKVKYKQTILGGLWAIIQPLFAMFVFTIFFGRLARIPSDNIPYPLFSLSGLVLWTYFANAVSGAGNSLVGDANLISKVYFPRIFIPFTPVAAGLLDLFIAFVFLLGFKFFYSLHIDFSILVVPLLILLTILTAAGVGSFLAALNAKYRDVRYVIPFLIQLWMFASPIVYPSSLLPDRYRLLYAMNPLVGIIEGFRAALLGLPFPVVTVAVSATAACGFFLTGVFYFKQTERYLADII
jgi:lipopolysaccharide transport system permease protein